MLHMWKTPSRNGMERTLKRWREETELFIFFAFARYKSFLFYISQDTAAAASVTTDRFVSLSLLLPPCFRLFSLSKTSDHVVNQMQAAAEKQTRFNSGCVKLSFSAIFNLAVSRHFIVL